MSKQRRWRGTSFEVNRGNENTMLENIKNLPAVTYAIWQLEQCPETGRLHYQFYIELKHASTWNIAKKIFGNTSHIEKCDATVAANIAYASKAETKIEGPWTYGKPSDGQGARHDLAEHVNTLKTLAKQGHDANEAFAIACDMNASIFRYCGSARMVVSGWRSLNNPKTTKERHLIIRCGAAGAGKTRGITERFGEENIYRHPGGEWFDGYNGQPVCTIDDVDEGWFRRHTADIKRWVDWSPVQVPVKGAYVWNGWDYLVITSNDPIHRLVVADEGLLRRCCELLFYTKAGDSYVTDDLLKVGNEVACNTIGH